ncbi:intradiol ring-cleavage dioxygenase [Seohaeicola zhoushanensis]|uniref:Twin-arginine translocation pathway signal protein n=1 Tax=Seohaeicola zhoushanensis TaxID=1569283 RepID=A0A8J3M552_9RHOB|nr:intradiol ring-cleavage dioxygenase [Seohaeicola zhoushanensis]GHF37526.1 twin-arginine translocation pathway signal protein [Seohaeicola zhoushanensis]
MTPSQSRRDFLATLAVSPFVTLGTGVFAPPVQAQAAAAGLIGANACILTPQVTEGPYYIDPHLVRQDITEGRPGVPMRLRLQVVTADCQPIEGARADVWHCDAAGNYSGFARQGSDQQISTKGETFLRGTQFSDATGIAEFATIYPGWYRGRTTHIHYKVFLEETNVLTGQIFFPDALSAYLFQSVAPYNERGGTRDTVNATDGIAQEAGDTAFAAIREQPDYYDAALVVGVSPEARPQEQGFGGMRPPGPPPGRLPERSGAAEPTVPGRNG